MNTHKDTLGVAVVHAAGRRVVHREIRNTEVGLNELEDLLATPSRP